MDLAVMPPDLLVAPFMGAWIEISQLEKLLQTNGVAPFMGAWIEIKKKQMKLLRTLKSHPSWVRGLKYFL